MNILIKNFNDKVECAEISAMIQVYTTPKYYDKMIADKHIIVKDERQLKSPTVVITKQGNGNLCFEFLDKVEE